MYRRRDRPGVGNRSDSGNRHLSSETVLTTPNRGAQVLRCARDTEWEKAKDTVAEPLYGSFQERGWRE